MLLKGVGPYSEANKGKADKTNLFFSHHETHLSLLIHLKFVVKTEERMMKQSS